MNKTHLKTLQVIINSMSKRKEWSQCVVSDDMLYITDGYRMLIAKNNDEFNISKFSDSKTLIDINNKLIFKQNFIELNVAEIEEKAKNKDNLLYSIKTDNFTIWFNTKYLYDGIKATKGTKIQLGNNGISPLRITSDDGDVEYFLCPYEVRKDKR